MPMYSYVCKSCQERWDEVRTLAEWSDPIVCPKELCKGEGEQTIAGPVAFSLKGAGWTPKHFEQGPGRKRR